MSTIFIMWWFVQDQGDGKTSVCVHLYILTDCKYVKAGLNIRWNITVLLLHVFKTSIKMLYCTFHDYIMSIMSESMIVCCWMIKSLFMLTYDFYSLCYSYIVSHSINWLLNISTMHCHYGKVMNIMKFQNDNYMCTNMKKGQTYIYLVLKKVMFSVQPVLLVISQRIVGNFTAVQYTVHNTLPVYDEALKNSLSCHQYLKTFSSLPSLIITVNTFKYKNKWQCTQFSRRCVFGCRCLL
jgi:hypothetical protein